MTEQAPQKRLTAIAIGAHPDDIEFMMAGTLLRLKDAGVELHMWNLANGSCGTAVHERAEIVRLRAEEARASAREAGATLHPALVDDLAIFYTPDLLTRVAAVIRAVRPDLVFTHSPQDYMEDHTNTCRLVVTAAFARGMRNYPTEPAAAPWGGDVVLYHALPHGLRDGLRRVIQPESYVDVGAVLARKRAMLSRHATQKAWLDVSQGMDSYLLEMEAMCRQVGRLSGLFEYAEGWRRHSHLGFGPADADPLRDLLGPAYWIDPEYAHGLEAGPAS
jgi:LmbE family N-acetylglucosaminyl deacetylase